MKLEDKFSDAEVAFINDTNVIFEDVTINGFDFNIDEDLVTDYIMIAGYTTEEAYEAAEAVALYESLN